MVVYHINSNNCTTCYFSNYINIFQTKLPMRDFFTKLKNILLTILSIFAIVELIRRIKSSDSDIDEEIDVINERIRFGEDALKEIDNANPDIDDIINDWNNDK